MVVGVIALGSSKPIAMIATLIILIIVVVVVVRRIISIAMIVGVASSNSGKH